MAANTPSTASLAIGLLRPVQAGSRPAISTLFIRSAPHHPILSCSPIIRRRNRDDPPADADGLPPKRNPDPALGACRSRCGRDSPRRREDWRPHGPPVAVGGPPPVSAAAQARQSLGHSGSQAGHEHDRHRRVVGGHTRAGQAPRRAHPRHPAFVCVSGAGPGREPHDDREVARPYPGSDDRPIRASGSGLDPDRRGTDHREHRWAYVVLSRC